MKRNLAVSSVLPTLMVCLHTPNAVVVQGFQHDPSSFPHSQQQYRSLKIRASKTINEQPPEQEDVDDESDWYAPPDFTVEDEHLFEEDKAVPKYMPPDFTIEDDDDDEDTAIPDPVDVIKEESIPISKKQATFIGKETMERRSPPPPKKKKPPVENMQATSWMEKNSKFAAPPKRQAEPERPKPEKRERRLTNREDRRNAGNNRTFRQDFRGTRVFVQGLAPETSWQSLKDHFRLAGEPVFASVSVDANTGKSKGCGVVQFETTEMAQNAIAMMRNHPLDGATLYVREDVQEKEGTRLRSSTPQRGDKQSTIPMSWSCADESTMEMLAEDEKTAIYSLIRARDDARKRRNYDASDDMREELKFKFGVHLDDRLKMWWVSPDGRRVPDAISEAKGGGRWGALKEWRQIPTTPENDACVNPDLVNGLLKQRDVARREKDFSTADALLEEARTAPDGDLNIRIHDESRTWRIWTDKPPRELLYGTQDKKMTPAEQCIEIVSEHAPEKLPEIESMLERFPGREYNILKKLKQRYKK
jgi:hypothetical protein